MKIEIDPAIRKRPPYVCGKCKRKALHNSRADAYYCRYCNRWTEKKCGDKTCVWCQERPKLPIKRRSA